jgi:hypothetical protein
MEKKILSNINRVVNTLIEVSYIDATGKEAYYNEAVQLIRDIHPLLMRLIDGKEELLEALIRQLISQKLPHPSIQSSFGSLQCDLNIIISRVLCKDEVTTTKIDTVCNSEDSPQQDVTDSASVSDESDVLQPEMLLDNSILDVAEQESTTELSRSDTDNIPAEAAQETITAVEQPSAVPPPDETTFLVGSLTEASVIEEKTASDNLQGIIDIIYANETIIKGFLYRSILFDYYLPEKKLAITTVKPMQRRHIWHETLLKKDGISLLQITPGEVRNKTLLFNKLQRYS